MATEPPKEDPTIKKIVLSSSASPVVGGGEVKRRKTRRSRAQEGGEGFVGNSPSSPVVVNKIGGGATSPGTMQQLAASHIPGNNSSKAVGAIAPFTATQAPVGAVAPAAANDPAAASTSAQKGGEAVTKVTLVKSRKAPRKLVLAAATKPIVGGGKRNKTAKKVKVSLAGLGKRLHHAKTIRKGATKKSLDEIKKALTEAKLVKADTKAPEDILRQMYADYMTLKKKAL